MSDYELLPVAGDLDLPAPVSAALIDLGIACNDAAAACDLAMHLQRTAITAGEAAIVGTTSGGFRQHAATLAVGCALSYGEQLTSTYAMLAATYAVAAAEVASRAAAGQTPHPPQPALVAPSRVLADPQRQVPQVTLPVGLPPDPTIVDHNRQLAAAHRRLAEVIATVRDSSAQDSSTLDAYDAPHRVAARPDGAIDLSGELPDALHAYAAACCWAIGLARRGPQAEPPAAR
jgi:hypothetical protein